MQAIDLEGGLDRDCGGHYCGDGCGLGDVFPRIETVNCSDADKVNYAGQLVEKIGDICLTPDELRQHQIVTDEYAKLVRILKERE
jgi:hypothetical protein